jgi:uncharacterized membrane protein YfcA
MELWYFPLLAVTGVAVGFLNVMAGGGSLISMPILIFLGLEPAMANGTNRVAILIQNMTAVPSFRSHGYSEMRRSLGLALCTVPGAVAGAFAAGGLRPAKAKAAATRSWPTSQWLESASGAAFCRRGSVF